MSTAVVLLVDDEVPFVETMTKRLSKRGVTVLTAFGGSEALQVLEKQPNIDIVVLDVKMPGMDGITTLKEIKKERPLVEVIMLTGHATVESAIEGMKLGAFDFLLKPCDIEQLVAKIHEAKGKRSAHKEKILQARVKEISMRRGG